MYFKSNKNIRHRPGKGPDSRSGGYRALFHSVGLSNILDSKLMKELQRRAPEKRPHRSVVGTCVMEGKLSGKVLEREEAV